MFLVWDAYWDHEFSAIFEFNFKTNKGIAKCQSKNVNQELKGVVENNKFVIKADFKSIDGFNLYADDLTEEDAGPMIKQFVLIEDNIGDGTSSALAGLIKMLK